MTGEPQGMLMTPGQVKDLFGITQGQLRNVVDRGELPFIRTPGGHRRYLWSEVRAREDLLRRRFEYLAREKQLREQLRPGGAR